MDENLINHAFKLFQRRTQLLNDLSQLEKFHKGIPGACNITLELNCTIEQRVSPTYIRNIPSALLLNMSPKTAQYITGILFDKLSAELDEVKEIIYHL